MSQGSQGWKWALGFVALAASVMGIVAHNGINRNAGVVALAASGGGLGLLGIFVSRRPGQLVADVLAILIALFVIASMASR